MSAKPRLNTDGRTVTVRVAISIKRRGGRKLVLPPDGAKITDAPVTRRVDNAMVKAIARAFRWCEMLEDGTCATIREIAQTENINESYIGRVLRMTLLAPDLVESILEGRHPSELQLRNIMQRFSVEWSQQHIFGGVDFSRLKAKLS